MVENYEKEEYHVSEYSSQYEIIGVGEMKEVKILS